MNFNTDLWSVLVDNGPEYFWKIALPATFFVMCLLMFSYIKRLAKTLGRQIARKGIKIKLQRGRELRKYQDTPAGTEKRAPGIRRSPFVR